MLSSRLATESDLPALKALMARAIAELQSAFLTPEQVEASKKVMGLDTQLVQDRTYFVIEDGAFRHRGRRRNRRLRRLEP